MTPHIHQMLRQSKGKVKAAPARSRPVSRHPPCTDTDKLDHPRRRHLLGTAPNSCPPARGTIAARAAAQPVEPAPSLAPPPPHLSDGSTGSGDVSFSAEDVLETTSASGTAMHLEVIRGAGSEGRGALCVAWQGVEYEAAPNSTGGWTLRPVGWWLTPSHPLVAALPGWSGAWGRVLATQPPARLKQELQVEQPRLVHSRQRLEAQAAADASRWCDGTGPGEDLPRGLDSQLLCAGEIAALLAGKRRVAMVQLAVCWDARSPQPIANPLALVMLRAALRTRGIGVFMSPAEGNLGLTAILAAPEHPHRAWAAHLASFGAQASLVAGSPYFKLLMGRVLGYKEANVLHHIQTVHGAGQPSPEVVAAVGRDLKEVAQAALKGAADKAAGRQAAAGGAGGGRTGGKRSRRR